MGEDLAAALRPHPVEDREVALLDPLAVPDDLLAALHRDDHRLHARRRLLAAPRRLHLIVDEGRPDHRDRDPEHRAAERRGLAVEARRGRPLDLLGRGRDVPHQGGIGQDPLGVRRAPVALADHEPPVAVRRQEREVADHDPVEPAPGQGGELTLHHLREAGRREGGEILGADEDLEAGDEGVVLREEAPLQLDRVLRPVAGRQRRRLLPHDLEGGMDAGHRLVGGAGVEEVDRALREGGLGAVPRGRLGVDDVVVAVGLDRRRGGGAEGLRAGEPVRPGGREEPRRRRGDHRDEEEPQAAPRPVAPGEAAEQPWSCRWM